MKLKVNWPYLTFCLVVLGSMCGFIIWLATSQTLDSIRRGQPNAGEWTWPVLIGTNLAFLAGFLWFAWKFYCDANTHITDDSISQPRLLGILEIPWSQTKKITTYGHGIAVHGQRGKIVLSPYAYKNSDEVIEKVAELAERHSLQFK